MAKIPNHLHRYKKVNLGRDGKEYFVYKCTKPVCPHYVPIELSLGKLCECNRCGEPMIIDKVTLEVQEVKLLQNHIVITALKERNQSKMWLLLQSIYRKFFHKRLHKTMYMSQSWLRNKEIHNDPK